MKKHAPFHDGFVWFAHSLALLGGFNIGAHLAWYIGMQRPLPMNFPLWIQVHGHLQLIGWLGLYIMGVSLYFIPRLFGIPLPFAFSQKWVLFLISHGILGESVFRLTLPHTIGIAWLYSTIHGGVLLSAVAVLLGTGIYVTQITLAGLQSSRRLSSGGRQLRPFLVLTLMGWIIYSIIHFLLVLKEYRQGGVILDFDWSQWIINGYIYLVLIPVGLAFSYRTFPLYLRLPPVSERVGIWGWFYGASIIFGWLPLCPPIYPRLASGWRGIVVVGRLAMDVIILIMVSKLKFTSPIPLPHVSQPPVGLPEWKQKPRKRYPDYGEFGKFEWLLYSAYAWLVLCVLVDIWGELASYLGYSFFVRRDPLRHAILLGFSTLLIFGMSQRMIGGFMGKKRLAYPGLVPWIAFLGNLSVLLRVIPLLLPAWIVLRYPLWTNWILRFFALSGWVAMIALGLLTWNLWRTKHASK